MFKLKITILLSSLFLFSSQALAISCGSAQRIADLSIATLCETGLGNPKRADINDLFGSDPKWQRVSSINKNTLGGSNGVFSILLDSGSDWGDKDISGQWNINASFWNEFDEAVISMKVGNGGGDPDFFAWKLASNSLSGDFSYERLAGGGGGLSNMKLWGRFTGLVQVKEPANFSLLALGLIGLFAARRYTLSQ